MSYTIVHSLRREVVDGKGAESSLRLDRVLYARKQKSLASSLAAMKGISSLLFTS